MKAKSFFKREIALLLVVVMLFSCWVFTATQSSSATAGKYTVSIDAQSENDGDCKGRECIIRYYENNGTGTTAKSTTICSSSSNFTFNGSGGDDGSAEISGFPYQIEYRLCKRGGLYSMGTLKYKINVKVQGIDLGTTGSKETSSEGWSSVTWNWQDSQKPYAKYIDSFGLASGQSATLTNPVGNNKVTKTISMGVVKDQYGVNWYQDPVAYVVSGAGYSVSGTTVTIGSGALATANPFTSQGKIGVRAGSSSGRVLQNGQTSTTDATVTFTGTNPKYTVEWYWHTNGNAASNWSGKTTQENIFYNQTPSAPEAAKQVLKYYDSAQHHSGGHYNPTAVTNTNYKFYMQYSTNENHDYNYTALASSDANYHLKHTATCKEATCGYSKTEDHDYDTTTFSFSQDGKTATATRVCKTNGCRHSQTETANVTSKVKTEATCTVKGTTTYTATSPFDGDTATDSVDKQDIAALGHSWKTPTFEWSNDCSSCTATRECNRDASHKETKTVTQIDSEVVAASTCTGKGTHKYTAHSPFAGDSTTNEKTLEDIAALGHDWNPTVITFAADGKTASATRTCKRDASHVETLAAPVSHVEKTAATCTEKGWTTYTATSPFAGDTATKSVDKEDIAALGHDWNPVTFEFAADGKTATATRVCRRDGEHVESAAAIMSHEVKTPATCEGDGTTTYTATSPWGDGATDAVDRVDIAAIGHSWGDWEDLGENGHRRVCTNDASHIESSATHTYTSYSKDLPEDATILAKLEAAGFNGETQCYRYCTACNNVEIKTHSYTPSITTQPTCTVGGVKTYTCDYCHTSYTQDLPALGHDPELVRGDQPYDTQAGAIYFCCKRGCGTYFPATDNGTEFEANLEVPCANPTEALNDKSAAKVPFPTFNTYTDGDIGDYNYSLRGASLKLSNEADRGLNTIQKMRFSGSVMVPVGMETTIDPANYTKYQAKQYDSIPDDSVIDFGFVYTQHRCLLYDGDDGSGAYTVDPTKFEMGKDNIYSMSVVHKNENSETFVFGENNWSGVTAHNENNGTTLTFNLLINVTQKNWKRNYAARTYIIYKYHGEIYLVYDNMVGGTTISDRAVWYVAKAVLAMYDEGEETSPAALNMVNYIKEKIVRDDQKVEKAIFAYAEEQESTPMDYFSDWWKAYNGRGLPVDETYDPEF